MSVLEVLRAGLSDRYTIERELGGGGMSVVFVATEHALGRRVVIKVLSPELGQTVNVERFKQEIATLATLQHPQIVPIYHAGQVGDLLYYVMPFVAGESLGARLAREATLPASEVVRLLTPLARALAFAHRAGVVHRDIKPDNILLAQGEPVLADFGIAKLLRDGATHGALTSAGMSIGTVPYMAPEQVVADPDLDGRVDVYSLAAVGYELLSGRVLFEGSPQQVMSAHVVKAPPLLADTAPATPRFLQEAIARGLAKEPADRPTAEQFTLLLEDATRRAADTSLDAPLAPAKVTSDAPRRGRLVGGLSLLVVIALAGTWWVLRRGEGTASTSAVVPTAARGLAVLPFERIGGPDDAYIAAGLTDELMGQLAEVPDLRVAARTSVRAYTDSTLTPTELGRRLDVNALVEGSVQREGDQLRVSTRLVDVRAGRTLWSKRYERQMRDLFAVQREIGASVVAALAPRLGLKATGGVVEAGTADMEAYDLFLRARFALQQRGADSLRAAVALFTRATARDPQFARAYAGIAEATVLLPQYGGGGYAEYAVVVRDAAQKALLIDSTLAVPQTALGLLAKGSGEWRAAEESFTRAIGRDPRLAVAHQSLGELYYTLGRTDDAVGAFERGALLEPANIPVVSEFAFALVLAGRVDSARRVIDGALARDANNGFTHFTQALIRERQGDRGGAVQSMRAALQRAPLPLFVGAQIRLAQGAADTGTERSARARLQAMGAAPGAALATAIAASATRSPAEITAAIERAIDERDPFMYQIPLRLWWFDRLRGTTEIARIATRLGLPQESVAASPAPR